MQPKIQTIPLCRLASGDELTLQIYQFCGKEPNSQKTYIQSNLHGAEIVGNVVIEELFNWLLDLNEEQLKGEIWLVPGCNPVGMNQRSHFFASGRYNPYDGKDWNRIFWDYDQEKPDVTSFTQNYLEAEPALIYQQYLSQIKTQFQENIQRREQQSAVPYPVKYQQILQSLCLDANHVIDIHSSSNQGIDYLFTFPGQEDSTSAFLLEVGIMVDEPEGYTFDEAFIKPWLSLQKTFAKLGRNLDLGLRSWTIELGSGMSVQAQSVAKGVQGIKNYLAEAGVVNVPGFPLKEAQIKQTRLVQKSQIKRYYAPTGGLLKTYPELRTEVTQGEVIYQILQLNKQGNKPELILVKAEASGFIFDRATNQSVNEGEYVLTILEKGDQNDS